MAQKRSLPENMTVPGVYIQEVSGGSRPIVAVDTSTVGFVGNSPISKTNKQVIAVDDLKATVIDNWSQFRDKYFSKPVEPANPETKWEEDGWTHLAYAVYGFFLNGGRRCWVVDMGDNRTDDQLEAALDVLATIDEIAIVAAPGFTDDAHYVKIQSHFQKHDIHDRVFIVDAPQALNTAVALQQYDPTPVKTEMGFTTMYVPWLRVSDPNRDRTQDSLTNVGQTVMVPPSGHVAGIWARSDAMHGVHKAPANEDVRGALELAHDISSQTQEALSRHGINVIRFFRDSGYLVWGARTLATQAEWRYLNVRRLFNMIEESVAEGTRWVVFEPNDEQLWASIRRDVSAFLMDLWRQGALMGTTPEQAFFVKCDAENNPSESIHKGCVIIDIGIAPMRPAEFVIFRISQCEAGVSVEIA